MAIQQSALRAARPFDLAGRVEGRRLWTISGIVTIIGALVVAGISFAILLGLTPVAHDVRATQVIIGVNLVFVLLLVGLIGRETFRIIMARRRRKAASRLHVRIVTIIGALVVAGISFAILLGLTPVAPDVRATQVIIGVNLVFVLLLVGLIGRETFRIIMARRRRKAASRLHVRIVTMFALVAAIPAPLGIGRVALSDSGTVSGFLCESHALEGAADITHFGGWRAYMAR